MTTQLYQKCLYKHSQPQVPCFKQQNSSHVHNNSNMRNTAIKPIKKQLQPFFMMSPSDLPAAPSSECLQERCSRYRHWETYDNKTNFKPKPKYANKTISTASVGVSRPPFKLKSDACAQPCRHLWKQQVNLELIKSTILLSLNQVNSSAFGTLLRDRYQGYTLRYSRVPWICIYPRGENAAVPVRGSWRGVGETALTRPVTSSITWVGGDFMSFTSNLLWMTPSETPKALQASECSELLDPMRASCWISAQH